MALNHVMLLVALLTEQILKLERLLHLMFELFSQLSNDGILHPEFLLMRDVFDRHTETVALLPPMVVGAFPINVAIGIARLSIVLRGVNVVL